MNVKKIYFDMDGVLADFNRGVEDILGLKAIDQSNKTEAQDDEMFATMREHEHFYDELEIMPGAKEMFDAVYNKYQDKCEILSGIPKPRRGIVNAGFDKEKWMHRLFAENVVVNIVFREEKKNYCTGPDCVLIDDLDINIEEWNALGGTGILHKDSASTMEKLHSLGIL